MKTIRKETVYEGYDGKTYTARAELTIDDDGSRWVSVYDYFDPKMGEWVETEERDWSDADIDDLFLKS